MTNTVDYCINHIFSSLNIFSQNNLFAHNSETLSEGKIYDETNPWCQFLNTQKTLKCSCSYMDITQMIILITLDVFYKQLVCKQLYSIL